jgi:hypothetical protein
MNISENQKMGNVMFKPDAASAAELMAGAQLTHTVPSRGRR